MYTVVNAMRMIRLRFFVLLLTLVLYYECSEFPADPKDTFKKINKGILIVGYTENPPWVILTNSDPEGIEPDLIRSFAKSIQAEILWYRGSENTLFQKLEQNDIHVIIGGLTDKSPWKKEKTGFTRPYYKNGKEKHVMAVIEGENKLLYKLEVFLNKAKIDTLRIRI